MNETGIASNTDNIAVMVDAWTLMVGRFPGHFIARGGGVAAIVGNVPLAFYNIVVLDRPVADVASLDRALSQARRHAEACDYPAMLARCGEWLPPGWEHAFAAAGLEHSTSVTGMATDLLQPPRRPIPLGLELRRVADVATATAVARLNAHAYGQPEHEVAFMENLRLWQPDSFGVVGYVEGLPVTTAAAFVIGNRVYIALVATEPGLDGRGYAEAAIELARAAAGPKRLWLHASDAGRPLYAAMGFTAGATTPVYAIG